MKSLLFVGLLGACGGVPAGIGESESAQKICATGATTTGIDVSHWDGAIDWSAMKRDGVTFAFIKATEGTTFADPQFATYWADAPQAGVLRGAYHFFRPNVDAVQQADFFIKTAGSPALGDLPLTIDLETTDNLPPATVAAAALQFLERVETVTGRTPIIYTSARVFDTVLGTPAGNFGHYPLWDANYSVTCPNISTPTWSGWAFWQTGDTGVLGGHSNLDVDVFNGSLSDLLAFAGATGGDSDGGLALDAGGSDAALAPPDDAAAPDDGGAHTTAAAKGCGCAVGAAAPPTAPRLALVVLVVLALVLARLTSRACTPRR